MLCYIDIETTPCENSALLEEISHDLSPPSNYGVEASVNWLLKETKKLSEKSQLNPFMGGEVCAVGWAFEEEPANSIVREADEAEESFLQAFWAAWGASRPSSPGDGIITWCGHNITGFDLPFLFMRHVVRGVRPSAPLHHAERPWSKLVIDTYLIYGGHGFKHNGLKNIAKLLGIWDLGWELSPEEITKAWKEGDPTLGEYVTEDVNMVRKVHQRSIDFA